MLPNDVRTMATRRVFAPRRHGAIDCDNMKRETYRGRLILAAPLRAHLRGWVPGGIIETRSGDKLITSRTYRPRARCRTLDEAIARSLNHARRLIDQELDGDR